MGWIVHQAIIVTTYSREGIDAAHQAAQRIFAGIVTEPVESAINGYWSFLIPPDGSKEGWPDSDRGDQRRATFHTWIAAQAYEDGSNAYDAIEVAYGEVTTPVIMAVDGHATGATFTRR